MIIEIEKKYELIGNDYKIIKKKCNFVSEKIVIDKFFDTKDYKLFNSGMKYRIRNGKIELKVKSDGPIQQFSRSMEHTNEDDINKILSKLNIKPDDLNEVLEVVTNREKYELIFKGINFIVDIDIFKYGKRYEIELTFEDDEGINASKLIDDFREYLGLTGKQNIGIGKIGISAQHENQELYEIILKLF